MFARKMPKTSDEDSLRRSLASIPPHENFPFVWSCMALPTQGTNHSLEWKLHNVFDIFPLCVLTAVWIHAGL